MLVIRNLIDLKTRKIVYYEFWGVASGATKIFKTLKKILRLMTFASRRSSCKSMFKDLQIVAVPNPYILKALLVVKSNIDILN